MPIPGFARAHFTVPIVVTMAVAFVFAWPVGLVILVYALWGEHFGWRSRVEAFLQGFAKGLRQDGCRCSPASIDFSSGLRSCDATTEGGDPRPRPAGAPRPPAS